MQSLLKSILNYRHYDIVLLGKTSAGKSASGNTILGREEFATKSIKNQTPGVQGGCVVIDVVNFTVYDTPGLFDPKTTNEDVMKQWQPLLDSDPSVSTVFLLVIKIDRFSSEEKKTVELIEKFLGDQRLQNTWILFTRGDELESEGLTIEKCISENEELERVVQRFNNRYHVFNNIKHDPDQVRRLIKKIRPNQSTPGPPAPGQPLVSTKTRVARAPPFSQDPDLCVGFGGIGWNKFKIAQFCKEPDTTLKKMGSNSVSSHCLGHSNVLKNLKAEAVWKETLSPPSQMAYEEKRYSPLDKGIKFVMRPSDLDPFDNDPNELRAQLSCGHITGPQTLTDYCRVLLESGKGQLTCPECKKEWPYSEIRRLAKLTTEEREFFESKLGENATKMILDYKACPGCHFFIERSNPSNLCVKCTVCCKRTGRNYEFCWQCLKEWKGHRPRSDRCDNEGCTNRELQLLLNCKTITLTQVQNIECPSVRACPTCGILIEHSTEKCKNIVCSRCNKEFCFLCLKLISECLKTSSYFKPCSAGVAPRQTSIPSWNN